MHECDMINKLQLLPTNNDKINEPVFTASEGLEEIRDG